MGNQVLDKLTKPPGQVFVTNDINHSNSKTSMYCLNLGRVPINGLDDLSCIFHLSPLSTSMTARAVGYAIDELAHLPMSLKRVLQGTFEVTYLLLCDLLRANCR
jgi:hypothetical protein